MADYDINVQKFIVTEKGDGSADIKQRIQKMGKDAISNGSNTSVHMKKHN